MRRVHRKAPTTTKMMVKAPTETMMTMTRMWFSLVPDLPEERRETGLDWKLFSPSMLTDVCCCGHLMAAIQQNLKASHQLQLKGLEGAGFQKVLALVEDLRLFRKGENTLSSFLTFICSHISSVKRAIVRCFFIHKQKKKTEDLAAIFSSVQEMKTFRASHKTEEGEFTLVISHFVSGLSLTGQRRAGRERQ